MKTMMSAALSFILFLSSLSYSWASNQHSDSDDIYEELWDMNMDIANKTLHVDFLQQMQNNSLQAERYVNFTLQDINFLLEITNMLKTMSERVKKPEDIRDFMKGRYTRFNNFVGMLLNQYFLKNTHSIKPAPAMKKYLANYKKVMKKDPIYFVVALLPCSRLWVWLATELDIPETSAYYTWKVNNMSGNPKRYKALLNKYLNTNAKIKTATALFRMQMQNEHDFFATS